VIVLQVQRRLCDVSSCRRRTFAEQVPGLTVRHGIATLPNGRIVYSSTDIDSSQDNLGAHSRH